MKNYIVTYWFFNTLSWKKEHAVFESFDTASEFVNQWIEDDRFRFVSIECI